MSQVNEILHDVLKEYCWHLPKKYKCILSHLGIGQSKLKQHMRKNHVIFKMDFNESETKSLKHNYNWYIS